MEQSEDEHQSDEEIDPESYVPAEEEEFIAEPKNILCVAKIYLDKVKYKKVTPNHLFVGTSLDDITSTNYYMEEIHRIMRTHTELEEKNPALVELYPTPPQFDKTQQVYQLNYGKKSVCSYSLFTLFKLLASSKWFEKEWSIEKI